MAQLIVSLLLDTNVLSELNPFEGAPG